MTRAIQKLIGHFSRFPGLGVRQARRFVYFLMSADAKFLNELSCAIRDIKKDIKQCTTCFRFYEREKEGGVCSLCDDESRDGETLMVIAKDIDLESVVQSDVYNGKFFVLGGLVPILEKNPEQQVRVVELKKTIQKMGSGGVKEIVIALSANVEGDNTTDYLKECLGDLQKKLGFSITVLGRGLSTGTELEYSDRDTLENALKNRA